VADDAGSFTLCIQLIQCRLCIIRSNYNCHTDATVKGARCQARSDCVRRDTRGAGGVYQGGGGRWYGFRIGEVTG